MKNKGYAKFWGANKVYYGNVQMANAAMSEFGSQVCPQILVSIFFLSV